MTADSLLSALRWRYATKQFDPSRSITDADWQALEESLVLTPSSFGLQPWKFLVVRDPALRAELLAQSWGQKQATDASHFVVLAARTDLTTGDIDSWLDRMAEVQGKSADAIEPLRNVITGFATKMTPQARHAWNIKQVYIALGQLMTSAALLGIDTCPMEGINMPGYDEILGLRDSGYATAVACALGYRSADDKYATTPKARFDPGMVIEYVDAG